MSPADFPTPPKPDRPPGITRSSLSVRLIVVAGALGTALTLVGCQAEPGDDKGGKSGSRELVDVNDRIVRYAGQAESRDAYKPPGDKDRERIARGVGHLLDGDREKAEHVLDDAGFRVTRLTDAVSGKRYDEVSASKSGNSARWGRLYLNADAKVRWSVQVPHPVADRDTESLGAHLMENTPGGALVVAGAHRDAGKGDAADVAHRTDSVFHAIVAELQKRRIPGIQLHGFAQSSNRPYEAILSTGAVPTVTPDVTGLADLLTDKGLRVCRGWSDRCELEGTTNVQGKAAKRHKATFLHVELAPKARGNGKDAKEAAEALSTVLAGWSGTAR
ncbi:hypothetical protein [Streptomyces sp. NPDC048057]|uniref:hypothetical protein n=1 Tax=Streptomyces sp. NPDC048057 TaxID=3155628 RepID=UPI0033D9D795